MAREGRLDYARWLMEQRAAALATAIESLTEVRPQVEFAPAEPEAGAAGPSGEALCWEQSYRDIPQPALWVTAPEATWTELGARTLRAAGGERDSGDPGESVREFFVVEPRPGQRRFPAGGHRRRQPGRQQL